MTTKFEIQVIVEPRPLTGAQNMDIDAGLLETVCDDETRGFVRIYEWSTPTITLGHFQKVDAVPDGPLALLPCVKRLTGGGAILHHQEITYSLAVPASHPFRGNPVQAYEKVHTAIIELMQYLGVQSLMRADQNPAHMDPANQKPTSSSSSEPPTERQLPEKSEENFLCFLRSDPRDIVSNGMKIVGSAQRRRKGSILQYGSILLKKSPFAPNMEGICDLWPNFEPDVFHDKLAGAIAAAIAHPT